MSRKTWLAIAAFAELLLGAYFILAFFAWVAKSVLQSTFSAGSSASSFPVALVIWLVLAVTSFVLYNRTKRKIKNLDEETLKAAKQAKKPKVTKETTAA